ncbi:MAG: hypothetical protein KAJ12_07560 [Bacteroidetes bacterium]|nr:hypothetical protein [Bacteroidota bacterium]
MKSLRFLLLFLSCSTVALGQPGSDTPSKDTASVREIILLDPGVALGKPTLLFPPSYEPGFTFGYPPLLYRGAHMGLPPSFISMEFEPKVDLLAPLRLQRKRERGLHTLYRVLGTVQAGAVAYIAYRHVKKYGFWK